MEEAFESFRMAEMTEPPWAPVLPMTAMIFLEDSSPEEEDEEDIVGQLSWVFVEGGFEWCCV